MNKEILNLSAAAKLIGISRPTLYKYLERPEYRPTIIAGYPTLSPGQVDMIIKERKNGKKR